MNVVVRKYQSLLAAAIAVCTALGALAVVERSARHLEVENERRISEYFFPQKLQGSALQKLAFTMRRFLPIYGSSELGAYKRERAVNSKPGDFFLQAPTGFVAFPVGRGGTTPLILLQDIASVGPVARGKKVVVVISPSWFTHPLDPGMYASNASILHSGSLLFGDLSDALKERVALRLLEYPEVWKKSDILRLAVHWYAGKTPRDLRLAHAFQPVGAVWLAFLRLADDVSTVAELQNPLEHFSEPPPLERRPVKWARAEAQSEQISSEQAVSAALRPVAVPLRPPPLVRRPVPGAARRKLPIYNIYRQDFGWEDYELLLQTLQESGVRPLLLSVPMDGQAGDKTRMPFLQRKVYYDRVREAAARHGFPVFTFEEHEYDGNFLINHTDHLTEKGWLYFDQIIDAFYHDKLPEAKS